MGGAPELAVAEQACGGDGDDRGDGCGKARDLPTGIALLWGEQDQPARGPKPSLTPQRIAEAAVTLADAEGLETVSMNKVAAGSGWRPRLSAWAHRQCGVYQAHPWLLAATAMRRQIMGPHQLAWMDAALAALEPTGLTAGQRHQVFLLIAGQVRNLAQQRADFDEDHNREWGRLTSELLNRHSNRFPALTKAIADGAFTSTQLDPLDFGLDRILDGVQVLIDRG
ncbi:TetR/AcrR family transcriptional regulator C-terminal domain-containing protein [Nonomuraea fuscirosea]|uniref:TetR/AcrR family transcriptional regulator C-terminal domain-containing protein n=1 Tax=Nonomuraea fuscirosea TaxID=1291556 RepID=UPI002DD824E7|nr:TetR/AcrR family transcriptional regulator C-terminal domain-containing protein [Nonomuraea fuscirosea]WSA56741.1 TetR/AcrR family transcriptional regulator C-terminal domain-containing protein [Nonomuraea fuscirosea]